MIYGHCMRVWVLEMHEVNARFLDKQQAKIATHITDIALLSSPCLHATIRFTSYTSSTVQGKYYFLALEYRTGERNKAWL
jgi:hypothetical protein